MGTPVEVGEVPETVAEPLELDSSPAVTVTIVLKVILLREVFVVFAKTANVVVVCSLISFT